MKKQQGGKRNFPAGRLLAALLSLCLLIGLVPGAQTTAFADGTDKAIVPGEMCIRDSSWTSLPSAPVMEERATRVCHASSPSPS